MDDTVLKQRKSSLENMLTVYLKSNPLLNSNSEVELRFGNNKTYHKIDKIGYDNVVKKLHSAGFQTSLPDGIQSLRIFHEYMNTKNGEQMMSNIRTEIVGTDLIQLYCETNSLQKILDHPSTSSDKLIFTQKTKAMDNGKFIEPIDFDDYNLRVSYQTENNFTSRSGLIKTIIDNWTNSKKTFRFLNRVRFHHSVLPIFVDISIVKKSNTTKGIPMKVYTIQDADVFSNKETYEVEVELDNSKIGVGTPYDKTEKLIEVINKSMRIILSGIQGTNYPISYSEIDRVQQSYIKLLYGEHNYKYTKVFPKNFIGPSSYTLQLENIKEIEENDNVPNIRKKYTVTDKADGSRSLLYIDENGKIYLLDTNMNVLFTGSKTENKILWNSLLDGEHIKFNKKGEFINLYASFDIYFVNKRSVREYPFVKIEEDTEGTAEEKETEPNQKLKTKINYRLEILNQFIEKLELSSVVKPTGEQNMVNPCNFQIKCKTFYVGDKNNSIFQSCSKILSDIKDGIYLYNTDGLIFTPAEYAVGSNVLDGKAAPLRKTTWELSFKWKPAEYNTIDFLVSVKKNKNTGKDEVYNIYEDGTNLQGFQNIKQYKTLVLRCGFDEKIHGYLNPCQTIIDDNFEISGNKDDEDSYKPVPFQPTNPYNPKACFANILLKTNDQNDMIMRTKEGEYFGENMIVEFSYDINAPEGWKWEPLRVRYDKTAELNNGFKNYGNSYHVANNNWYSLHRPITDEMISTGENIPNYLENMENDDMVNDGVYYNRKSQDRNKTKSMRDFHNLYVKRKLINAVSRRGDNLIDYAVGQGGDLPKWISANLSFVFGIDISRDNLHNKFDGACARYLNQLKEKKRIPKALFVNGDSGNLIRTGEAFKTEKDRQISDAIFGKGPKDPAILGKGVYNQYGIAVDGFNISSCQFAMHYFFENLVKLNKFMRNLSECTKLNGYFIGTCYDGETVFKLLKRKNEGETVIKFDGERKMFELTKLYSQTGFPDDETSVGYTISVYQDTINKTFREYLVNFGYFQRLMENYGFKLISKEESQNLRLPNATGLFSELFEHMKTETERRAEFGSAFKMTEEEKDISFMNRYFVFKKFRNVNAEKISKIIIEKEKHSDTEEEMRDIQDIEREEDKKQEPEKRIIIKKNKGKKIKITVPIIEPLIQDEPKSDAPTDEEQKELAKQPMEEAPQQKQIKIKIIKKKK